MELLKDKGMQYKSLRTNTAGEPSILMVGMLYSVTVALFIFGGSFIRIGGFYVRSLLAEIILILFPPLIALYIFKHDFKKVLRLNKIGFLELFLIFWIINFSLPIVAVFNIINLWLAELIFGEATVVQPPVAADYPNLLFSIIVVGVAAGVCEEVLFRGVIMRGLERLGPAVSIIMTAFLFSIMHISFEKLFGTFLLGAIIGFIVWRTNSIYGGIFAHFVNNTIGLITIYTTSKLSGMAGMSQVDVSESLDSLSDIFSKMKMSDIAVFIIVWGIILLFSGFILAALIIALVKITEPNFRVNNENMSIENRSNENIICGVEKRNKKKVNIAELLTFIPGIILLVLTYFLSVR